MKKFLVIAMVLLALLGVALFFAADYVLEKASNTALQFLTAEGKSTGINVDYAEFGDVSLGLEALTWSNFVAVLNAPNYIALEPGEDIMVNIGAISLGLPKLAEGVAEVTARDIRVRVERGAPAGGTQTELQEGLRDGQFKATLPFGSPGKSPSAASLMDVPKSILTFLQEGKTTIPFDFQAKSVFKVGESTVEANITTTQDGGYYFLLMSPDDLKRITALFKEDLTESELRLVSTHPLLAPALLKIRNYARTRAESAYAKDPKVPEDAYRHVLWSFLLTKQFGEELAKQATDAHEIGSINRNTDAEHQMDYQNNKVGREYVLAGYTEDRILELVLTDSQVVRYPKE